MLKGASSGARDSVRPAGWEFDISSDQGLCRGDHKDQGRKGRDGGKWILPSRANLDAEYNAIPGTPVKPTLLLMLIMVPLFFSRMCGSTALMIRSGPKKLVSNCSRARSILSLLIVGQPSSFPSIVPVIATMNRGTIADAASFNIVNIPRILDRPGNPESSVVN